MISVRLGESAKEFWDYAPLVAQIITAAAAMLGPYVGWRIARYQLSTNLLTAKSQERADALDEDIARLIALSNGIERVLEGALSSDEIVRDQRADKEEIHRLRIEQHDILARTYLRIDPDTEAGEHLLKAVIKLVMGEPHSAARQGGSTAPEPEELKPDPHASEAQRHETAAVQTSKRHDTQVVEAAVAYRKDEWERFKRGL